jgi:hypothetical protein
MVAARHRHGWGLLVGETDERGVLRCRGRVEFGITEDVVTAMQERLAPLVRRTSPFGQRVNEPDATYVERLGRDSVFGADVAGADTRCSGRSADAGTAATTPE